MEQNKICIKARLVAQKEEGQYINYVFENTSTHEFVMCTRVPNWSGDLPHLMQEGYLEYKDVQAGTSTYFDNVDNTFRAYQYTATYFQSFVPITHVLRDGFVVNHTQLKVS